MMQYIADHHNIHRRNLPYHSTL